MLCKMLLCPCFNQLLRITTGSQKDRKGHFTSDKSEGLKGQPFVQGPSAIRGSDGARAQGF